MRSSSICCVMVRITSDPAEGAEATIHRDNSSRDEFRAVRYQPHQRADEFFRFTKAAHRRIVHDELAARRERTVFIGDDLTVLVCDEKARRDGVDTNAGA